MCIPRSKWKIIQKGESIEFNNRIITLEMILGEPRKGIKLTYVTDSRPTESIIAHATGSDLLICEGMYGDPDKQNKAIRNGHMMFREAAEVAKQAEVAEMWLTHYSSSMNDPFEYMDEVQEIFPLAKAGRDGMSTTLSFS